MNNPFYYQPSPECLQAARELADWLYGKPSPFCPHPVSREFREEIDKGKMFGVLVVERNNQNPQTSDLKPQTYLAAYSGQVCGRSDWPEFVPAVFDYLQPDGYFKRHEMEIVGISEKLKSEQEQPATEETAVDDPRPVFDKRQREGESDEEYVSRRQFENAELHRWKLRERQRKASLEAGQRHKAEVVAGLKTLRREKSDSLQRWLFRHFVMVNGKGEKKDLLEINDRIPPAGSGECCEPKLLQYAFTHGCKPKSMAMFWWGASPRNEIRHHLHFYPACNSKCKPILGWMLQGIDVDPNPLESKEQDERLAAKIRTLYEDDDICVISKPAGLLSVPGNSGRGSVLSIMRSRYPMSGSPLIVHRLDMDTSGLMVIAKTVAAYHNLQRQFAGHEIRKRYVAVLEKPAGSADIRQGNDLSGNEDFKVISLPLRPDLDDRPRQVVDFKLGKKAVTYYKFVDNDRVWLWPQTGRTHQLRMHCAHRLGLDNPIKGDRLYGNYSAPRLYLHAEKLTFTHPSTGRKMTFTDKAPF